MTLHWWQHWFWITGRAPVVAVLLLVCRDAWGQQVGHAPWGVLDLVQDLDGVHFQAPQWVVPVHTVHLPAWTPWAPRRLLGFAGPTLGDDAPLSPEPPLAATTPQAAAASPVAVTYLTTRGPGQRSASTSQPPEAPKPPRAREPKAIGVLPTTSAPPRHPPPSTATTILEIIEEVAESGTASPSSAETPTSAEPPASPSVQPPSTTTVETGTEDEAGGPDVASSAEMPNDEPAKAVSVPTTATPAETTAESASPEPSAPSASPTMPSRIQTSSLTAAPATGGYVAITPVVLNVTRGTSAPVLTTAKSTADLDPKLAPAIHPGLSTPRRSAVGSTPAQANTSAAASATDASTDQPFRQRAAPTPLGAASASTIKQHHPGGPGPGPGQGGPGAMSLSSGGGLDAGSITGIVLGIVVFAGLVGTVSFVLYRRRYLNKPQTLNDKCSNPDSSGYIDDSTLRENSEEMYSLDNDSFLNSLEAMTIQNYWTDTVKHTKL